MNYTRCCGYVLFLFGFIKANITNPIPNNEQIVLIRYLIFVNQAKIANLKPTIININSNVLFIHLVLLLIKTDCIRFYVYLKNILLYLLLLFFHFWSILNSNYSYKVELLVIIAYLNLN